MHSVGITGTVLDAAGTAVNKRQKSLMELTVYRVEIANSEVSQVPGSDKFY